MYELKPFLLLGGAARGVKAFLDFENYALFRGYVVLCNTKFSGVTQSEIDCEIRTGNWR